MATSLASPRSSSSRLARRSAPALALALAALPLALLAGCLDDNPCNGTVSTRCIDGKTLEICIHMGDDNIDGVSRRPCLGNAPVCVTAAPGQALCALRATPEPACAALPSWGTACDGARKLRCERGFVTAEERCTGSCFMGSAGATCSLLASPDPACAASASTPFASGSACADPTTRIDCDRGWRVASKVCTTTGGCQTVPTRRGTGTTGLCTVGVAADPRCLLDDPSSHEICGDGGSITCMEGYVVQELVCMGQQVCPSVGPTVCPGGILSSQGDPHGR